MGVDHVVALAARLKASRARAAWLAALASSMVTLDEVILVAGEVSGRPIRSLRLHQLLGAQRDWGDVRTRAVIERMGVILGARLERRRLTVAWLLDGRSPARFDAWTMARRGPASPWPGFPFTPSPASEVAPR